MPSFVNRRGGTIAFRIDGELYLCKGNFHYGLGGVKREAILGAGRVHGYKDVTEAAFIEGEFTDTHDLDQKKLKNLDGVNISMELANGKTILLRNAWCSELSSNTEEGNISVKFEAEEGEEIR